MDNNDIALEIIHRINNSNPSLLKDLSMMYHMAVEDGVALMIPNRNLPRDAMIYITHNPMGDDKYNIGINDYRGKHSILVEVSFKWIVDYLESLLR